MGVKVQRLGFRVSGLGLGLIGASIITNTVPEGSLLQLHHNIPERLFDASIRG